MNSSSCVGCKARDIKLQSLATEIAKQNKRIEQQDELIRYLRSKISADNEVDSLIQLPLEVEISEATNEIKTEPIENTEINVINADLMDFNNAAEDATLTLHRILKRNLTF